MLCSPTRHLLELQLQLQWVCQALGPARPMEVSVTLLYEDDTEVS